MKKHQNSWLLSIEAYFDNFYEAEAENCASYVFVLKIRTSSFAKHCMAVSMFDAKFSISL